MTGPFRPNASTSPRRSFVSRTSTHACVELLTTGSRDTDGVKSVRHEMPVHHVARSALGSIEVEPLKRGEQEIGYGLLEDAAQFDLNELDAASVEAAEVLTAPFGRRRHVATVRAESHPWGDLLLSFTSEVPRLQGLISRDQVLQVIGDLLFGGIAPDANADTSQHAGVPSRSAARLRDRCKRGHVAGTHVGEVTTITSQQITDRNRQRADRRPARRHRSCRCRRFRRTPGGGELPCAPQAHRQEVPAAPGRAKPEKKTSAKFTTRPWMLPCSTLIEV
jgi:hypothetical protein